MSSIENDSKVSYGVIGGKMVLFELIWPLDILSLSSLEPTIITSVSTHSILIFANLCRKTFMKSSLDRLGGIQSSTQLWYLFILALVLKIIFGLFLLKSCICRGELVAFTEVKQCRVKHLELPGQVDRSWPLAGSLAGHSWTLQCVRVISLKLFNPP